ncbi:MAG: hypothetical protein ACI8PZ_001722 [Myxococcota bacterium]|jgi:hypothetical protein
MYRNQSTLPSHALEAVAAVIVLSGALGASFLWFAAVGSAAW